MKKELKTALIQYTQLLQAEGKTHVKLEKPARTYLKQLRAGTQPAPALDPRVSHKTPVTGPVSNLVQSPPQERSISTGKVAESPSEKIAIEGRTREEKLTHLAARASLCQKCSHLARFRTKVVFGVGDPHASLMFVGEAPGAEEDKLGEPFVGRAGDLLTKMIRAMGLSRERVYIANILKCRPDMPAGAPGNRKPTLDEMSTCSPYLMAQIEIIRPQVMVGLGATAVEGLLGSKGTISKLRGNFQDFRGIPFMPTFHPSYLLHNPTLEIKRKVWEDLLQVLDLLKMPITEKQRAFFLPPS